jgi:hypothetical protein
MSVFKLADDHPLTKAGLRCVHLVETAERGLRVGDLVFEFPFGRIVDTGMACRRDGIVPLGLDLMTVHKEATAVRAADSEQRREVEGVNVLPLANHPRRECQGPLGTQGVRPLNKGVNGRRAAVTDQFGPH